MFKTVELYVVCCLYHISYMLYVAHMLQSGIVKSGLPRTRFSQQADIVSTWFRSRSKAKDLLLCTPTPDPDSWTLTRNVIQKIRLLFDKNYFLPNESSLNVFKVTQYVSWYSYRGQSQECTTKGSGLQFKTITSSVHCLVAEKNRYGDKGPHYPSF